MAMIILMTTEMIPDSIPEKQEEDPEMDAVRSGLEFRCTID